jgi:N-acetylglutamate synthase-like GNAT family acetyltransferase
VYGVAAEEPTNQGPRVVGSCFLWELGQIAGIGPVTVDPTVQARRVGRQLMESVLARARVDGVAGVRLVQAAFNTQSMSLYAKLGFDVREPLVVMNGDLIAQPVDGYPVRKATPADVDHCADLCYRVHGHDRRAEVAAAVEHGTATVVERTGRVVAYATEVGFFGHAVSLDNAGLIALISNAKQFTGPGFLLPSRNGEVFRWCLSRGLRVVQPMTLMSVGLYNEPGGAFLPSILF